MTVSLLHSKVSGKVAGSDATRVYGNHWDAEHVLTGTANSLIRFNSSGEAESFQKTVRVVTTTNVAIVITDHVVVINKASASATTITFPSVALVDPNFELEIYDWAGNAGDMTLVAAGSEMWNGAAGNWTVGSGGTAQTGGSLKIRPCADLGGWLVR